MDTLDIAAPAPAADPTPPAAPVPDKPLTADDVKAMAAQIAADMVKTALDHALKPSEIPVAELHTLVNDVKPFWQSKTLITLIATGGAALAGMVGVTADPKGAVVTAIATLAFTAGSALLAAVFHAMSTKKPV